MNKGNGLHRVYDKPEPEERIRLSPEKVLAVVAEPGLEHVENLKARAGRLGVEVVPGIADAIREGLAESWSVIVGRGAA